MAATPTTLDALQAAFVAAISAITPRTVQQQITGAWKFFEGDRVPSTNTRAYSLDWDSEGYTRGGFMGSAANLGGVDTTVTCTVIVDYAGIHARVIKRVAEDDWYQLRDVLSDLKPTTNGLLYLEAQDWAFLNSDKNQAQIGYQFRVRYMKARAQ